MENGKVSGEKPMKNGKPALSDRDKYRQLATNTGNVLTVPDILVDHFNSEGLAFKWVSKRKISKNGGFHPSNWIPYELSADQKDKLPKTMLGNTSSSFLERDDLILAVKPQELREAHKKELKDKTDRQLASYYNEIDAKGKKILRDEE